jgi:AcrR family transcriptional regulator
MTTGTAGQPQGTGAARRRSGRAHQAILAATAHLLAEMGYTALTIEGVAARAGVGKATVYRWWPSKGALVIEAMATTLVMPPLAESGNLRQDLITVVGAIVQALARSPAGAVIPALAADLLHDPEMAEQFRDQVIRPRRAAVTGILRRAAERGELPPDVDTDLLLDVYVGAVFYRVLVSGEPVTDLLAEQLVSLLFDGKTPVKIIGTAAVTP